MLIENIRKDEYVGFVGDVTLDNWGGEMEVHFPSETKREYAEKCVEYMQNMDNNTMHRLAKYLYRYFRYFSKFFDDDDFEEFLQMPRNVSEEDILKYVQPGTIMIEEGCREDRIEFHVGGSCNWEIEHGFEFTISDGKILYVGSFDDVPPYNAKGLEYLGFYDEKADTIMNYADKEQ